MRNLVNQRCENTGKRSGLLSFVLVIALGLFLIPLSDLHGSGEPVQHSHQTSIVDPPVPMPDQADHGGALAQCGPSFCAPSLAGLVTAAKKDERDGASAVRFAYSDQIVDSLYLDRDPPIPRT